MLSQPVSPFQKHFTNNINTQLNYKNNINESFLKQIRKVDTLELLRNFRVNDPKRTHLVEAYSEAHIKLTIAFLEYEKKLDPALIVDAIQKNYFEDDINTRIKHQKRRNLYKKYKKRISKAIQEFLILSKNRWKSINEEKIEAHKKEYLSFIRDKNPKLYKDLMDENNTAWREKEIKDYVYYKNIPAELKDISAFIENFLNNEIKIFCETDDKKSLANFNLFDKVYYINDIKSLLISKYNN